jgi:hypothetical protein
MAKKATVARRAIKSGMAGLYRIGHARSENSTSSRLQFLAKHKTLQFAGLSSCELQQFAFTLVQLEAFAQARLRSGAQDGKRLMVL